MRYLCRQCESPVSSFTYFCVHCGERVDVIDEQNNVVHQQYKLKPVKRQTKLKRKRKSKVKRPYYSCNNCNMNFINKSDCIKHIEKEHNQLYKMNNNSFYNLYTLKGMQ